MARNAYNVSNQWPGTAQYTASGTTGVLICAPNGDDVHFLTDTSDTTDFSAVDVRTGARVAQGGNWGLELNDGESLYLVVPGAEGGETVTVTVLD